MHDREQLPVSSHVELKPLQVPHAAQVSGPHGSPTTSPPRRKQSSTSIVVVPSQEPVLQVKSVRDRDRVPARSHGVANEHDVNEPMFGDWHVVPSNDGNFSQLPSAMLHTPTLHASSSDVQSTAENSHLLSVRLQTPGRWHGSGGVWQSAALSHSTGGGASGADEASMAELLASGVEAAASLLTSELPEESKLQPTANQASNPRTPGVRESPGT